MPDPVNPTLSNSYGGKEIILGAQRIHNPELLTAWMKEAGINPAQMKGYLDGFRLACPAHTGSRIGLKRVVMLFFSLGNIRKACLAVASVLEVEASAFVAVAALWIQTIRVDLF
ncbi:hypothetical protein PTTG_25403 [Puccinia triticina 1-1 BBBD Race 1]|uniref:tRNA-synt_2 domain-containing protein n=1 Tax=Puccinia triticina (isolate 1-1 / race 1 (BBBD)) TaxID=630390 RepID=A0A180H3G1_PUCT1|nr:hypothetical protein PTTG_25403 [Puccinia triticina 1-1 BBBD Race 1]